jgi:hypothetical protein
MNERDWQSELEHFLEVRFVEFCKSVDQPVPPSGLRIAPPVTPNEAKCFLWGMETGLFAIDEKGYVQSPLLLSPDARDAKQKMCQIFWLNPPPPRLFREGICQLSTAAELIFDRGWLERQIEIEPTMEGHGSMAHGVDILVSSIDGKLLACVEVKRSAQELTKLKADFNQCCKRGKHPENNCGFPLNHAKYEFCASYKPIYFWGVAPGADICFKMNYCDDDTIELDELPSLPPRSIVEMA